MDSIINFIFSHAHHAHWIVFGSLLLAGFNIPISEDLLIIISALLASTIIPEHTLLLLTFVFMGCFLSDIIIYWIARTLGRKLLQIAWFKKTLPQKKLEKIESFYKKHGLPTLIIGRFIPFGVRNCLFIAAGISRVSFRKFFIGDGVACMISNLSLFFLTFFLGKNYPTVWKYLKTFNLFIFILFIVSFISIILIYRKKRKNRLEQENQTKE